MRGGFHTQWLLGQNLPVTATRVESEVTHETGVERRQETRGWGRGQDGHSGDMSSLWVNLIKCIFILQYHLESWGAVL